jgi:hypothetical protein
MCFPGQALDSCTGGENLYTVGGTPACQAFDEDVPEEIVLTTGRSDGNPHAFQVTCSSFVQPANGMAVDSSVPFTPEVVIGNSRHPLCGYGFHGARDLCKGFGFPHGGKAIWNNEVFETDALNDRGEFEGDERCKAGNPVGIQIVCHAQCRTFFDYKEDFDNEVALKSCHPYLSDDRTYYLVDTPDIDDTESNNGVSNFAQFTDIVEIAMNPKCAANVVSLMCHTTFKECTEIVDESKPTGSLWVPSLLCRSECERHLAIWDQCLQNVGADPEAKETFDTQMLALVDLTHAFSKGMFSTGALPDGAGYRSSFRLLQCDAQGGQNDQIPDEDSAIAFLLGQSRQSSKHPVFGTSSIYYPFDMADGFLYPEVSSMYVSVDGKEYESSCFVPRKASAVAKADCPYPFVNPIDENHLQSCIQACPTAAYTNEEYDTMWTVSVCIGTLGFGLNCYLVATWALGGKKSFHALPFQLKFCVFAGIAYFFWGVLPMLLLKRSTM